MVGGALCSSTRPLVQPAGQAGHAPLQPVGSERGSLICLPGRVPVPPRLGPVLTGSLEDTLGAASNRSLAASNASPGAFASGLGFG